MSSPPCSAPSPWATSCCRRARPQSKGGVERTNGYLETSFLPLRSFADLADLQAQSDAWATEVAWQRHHRRVGARVTEALAVERAELAPLPDPAAARPTATSRCAPAATASCASPASTTRCRRASPAAARAGAALAHELRIFCEGRQIAAPRAQLRARRRGARPRAHARPCAPPRRRSDASGAASPSCRGVDLARYDALLGVPL